MAYLIPQMVCFDFEQFPKMGPPPAEDRDPEDPLGYEWVWCSPTDEDNVFVVMDQPLRTLNINVNDVVRVDEDHYFTELVQASGWWSFRLEYNESYHDSHPDNEKEPLHMLLEKAGCEVLWVRDSTYIVAVPAQHDPKLFLDAFKDNLNHNIGKLVSV